ncbi:MAG: hypothetical protein ACOZNI_16245 [Myxococcota bacterium]
MTLNEAVVFGIIGIVVAVTCTVGGTGLGFGATVLGLWAIERDRGHVLEEENQQLRQLEVREAADSAATSPPSTSASGAPMISIVNTTSINNYYGGGDRPDADLYEVEAPCRALWSRIRSDRETRDRQIGEDDFTSWLDREIAKRETQYRRECGN